MSCLCILLLISYIVTVTAPSSGELFSLLYRFFASLSLRLSAATLSSWQRQLRLVRASHNGASGRIAPLGNGSRLRRIEARLPAPRRLQTVSNSRQGCIHGLALPRVRLCEHLYSIQLDRRPVELAEIQHAKPVSARQPSISGELHASIPRD